MNEPETEIEAVEERDNVPNVYVVILGESSGYGNDDANATKEELKEEWDRIWDGNPPAPLFVLPPGSRFGTV